MYSIDVCVNLTPSTPHWQAFFTFIELHSPNYSHNVGIFAPLLTS